MRLRSYVNKMVITGAFVLALTVASAVAATSAQAKPVTTPPQAFGWVHNGASPRCLDTGVPANAQLWTCNGSVFQRWTMGYFGQISGQSPAGCLDDDAGLNGSGVRVTTCTGSSHQTWYFSSTPGLIVNAGSGRCLDADAHGLGQDGTKVQVWDCNGGPVNDGPSSTTGESISAGRAFARAFARAVARRWPRRHSTIRARSGHHGVARPGTHHSGELGDARSRWGGLARRGRAGRRPAASAR